MVLQRYSTLKAKEGRETIFLRDVGYPKGTFREDVRKYANGLLNSHGGVIYFGVNTNGSVVGTKIPRKEEDDYRLAVDHTFSAMQPMVSVNHYRLSFIPVNDRGSSYSIIELKVSVGEVGEIYEDGCLKVYLVDSSRLIGPLYPQELKELILLKYKESLEGAQEAARFATPNLALAREAAKKAAEQKIAPTMTKINEVPERHNDENKNPQQKTETVTRPKTDRGFDRLDQNKEEQAEKIIAYKKTAVTKDYFSDTTRTLSNEKNKDDHGTGKIPEDTKETHPSKLEVTHSSKRDETQPSKPEVRTGFKRFLSDIKPVKLTRKKVDYDSSFF